MKLKGRKVSGSYIETVVIPRPPIIETKEDGTTKEVEQYHVFKLAAVLDYDDFDKLCPQPEPPPVIRPNQPTTRNVEDATYKKEVEQWAIKRMNWAILRSLSATEDLEWETIDMSQPETWTNVEKELKDAGFSAIEVGRIFNAFHIANNMNEAKMEEARKSFFRTQAKPNQ